MKKIIIVVFLLFLLCGSNIITYYATNQKIDLSFVSKHQVSTTLENNNMNKEEDSYYCNIVTKDIPEVMTSVKIIDSDQYWNETIMNTISDGPIYDEGFMSKPSQKKWILEIFNPTLKDISNIRIDYTITTFKHYITFGRDKLDIVAYQPRQYKKTTNTLCIENIKSNELVELDLFYMATFPQVKVEIESIKINEICISNEHLIYYYYCDEFESIGDSQDLRRLLGITY